MTKKELEEKVRLLEERIAILESRPIYIPYPAPQPVNPYYNPWAPVTYTTTTGAELKPL